MENSDNKRKRLAVITGADGGMGREITRAVAMAGYRVIMASCRVRKAEEVRRTLLQERAGLDIEVREMDLASFISVCAFADTLVADNERVDLLMNNAGTMETGYHYTGDGMERTVQVNYMGHYLLTRKLLKLMGPGSRIVNMVSCTYAIGRLDFPDFFHSGRKGTFWRIPVYSNTKLALLLFTLDLAGRVRDRGITVNAADPGIVSTDRRGAGRRFRGCADGTRASQRAGLCEPYAQGRERPQRMPSQQLLHRPHVHHRHGLPSASG